MTVESTNTFRPARGRRRSIAVATALLTGLAGLAALPATSAVAASGTPNTTQLSVWTGGFAPGWGSNGEVDGGGSRQVSDNGRYVAMAVSGPIVPGQAQVSWQVVLRDRLLGTSTLVSKSTSGRMGNATSGYPSISADGRVVAFHSHASNLVPGDTNGTSDVFVHDTATGKTSRASVTSSGAQVPVAGPGTNPVGEPSVSADGRYVGFVASAAGYTADDGMSGNTRAYLHDRATGQIEVVSRSVAGVVIDSMAGTMVVPSADGNRVAYIAGIGGDPAVLVRDRAAATTTIVHPGSEGAEKFDLSSDGRFVAYGSRTGNLGAVQQFAHIFVHDLQTNTTDRVSTSTSGAPANARSSRPVLSKDGRYVAFQSEASNLVVGDTNGQVDAFRHDRTTGQTIRISVANSGAQTTGYGSNASISGDGQHVVFVGQHGAFTPVATHGYRQYYVRDLAGRYPALFARVPSLPGRVNPKAQYRVAVRDIRTGPALVVTWKPARKGATIKQSAAVASNRFTLRAPKRPGAYTVTVSYAGHRVGGRKITVIKPSAAMATKVKPRKAIQVRTSGLPKGKAINVRFTPRGKTKGKAVVRKARINAKGVATVKSPPRRGIYRVVVRGDGLVLRSAKITVR